MNIRPHDERQLAISHRASEAVEGGLVRQEFKFRSGKELLPLITLPQQYLLYRLENYRTSDAQLSLVAEGKVEVGFFSPARCEDPSVQQAQHALLVELAQTGSGETIKPIYDELERVAEQTEPLIITRSGIVVNGNRRLAAMRELLADADDQTYASFANVSCVVLPGSATPEEILELEIGLQMQPDTKLPYEWTAIGRAARDLRNAGCDDDKIARLMNRDPKDVRRAIAMINAADQYLSEWLGRPNAYSYLEDTEQAFIQVATRNLRDDEPELREITRKFDFFLIEQREHLPERAYGLINKIEESPRAFLDQIAVEWDITLPKSQPKEDDDLEISFDEDTADKTDYSILVQPLLAARGKKDEAEQRVRSVAQACEIVSSESKEGGKAALKFARQAYKSVDAIELRRADPATYGELYSLLKSCSETCQDLMAQIDAKRSA